MVLFCTENPVLVFLVFYFYFIFYFIFIFLGFSSCVLLFFFNVFVVFHCMVLLCALALCVYLCVGLLYIDIVYCTSLYFLYVAASLRNK